MKLPANLSQSTFRQLKLFDPSLHGRAQFHSNIACYNQKSTARDFKHWRVPLNTDGSSVVALGKFDALHTGHRALAQQASGMGDQPWMVSFSGMAEVMSWPRRAPLVAPYDRGRVLHSWATACNNKVPRQLWIPFEDVRTMSPEEFVHVLARDLQVTGVVVGEGFRFGYRAAGTTDTLEALGPDLGLAVSVVNLVEAATSSDCPIVSSSKVREALNAGSMSEVTAYLDRLYCLVARLTQEQLLRHTGNALGSEFLRRIPRICFENQPPGKGIYQARIVIIPGTSELDPRQLEDMKPAMVAITDFGLDIILPAKIAAPAISDMQLAVIEFESVVSKS